MATDILWVVVHPMVCSWVKGRGAPTVDTVFYNILNAFGDIYERTSCHKVILFVENKLL